MEEERKDTPAVGAKRAPEPAHHQFHDPTDAVAEGDPSSSSSSVRDSAQSSVGATAGVGSAKEPVEKAPKHRKTEGNDDGMSGKESATDTHGSTPYTSVGASATTIYPGGREELTQKTSSVNLSSAQDNDGMRVEKNEPDGANNPESYLLHMLTFFIEVDYVLSQHLDRQRRLVKHVENNIYDIVQQMIQAKRTRKRDLSEAFSEINGAKDPFDYVAFIEEHSPGSMPSHFAVRCLTDKYVECYRTHEKTIEGQQIPILAAEDPQILGLVSAGFQQELQSSYEVQQTPVQSVSNEISKAFETLDGSAELAVRYTVGLMPSQEACFRGHSGAGQSSSSNLQLESETCESLIKTRDEYMEKKLEVRDDSLSKVKACQYLLGATSFRLPSPWDQLFTALQSHSTSTEYKEVTDTNYRTLFERWGIFDVSKHFEFFQALAENSNEEIVSQTCQRLVDDNDSWLGFCKIAKTLCCIDITGLTSHKEHNERLKGDSSRFSSLKPEEFADASGWFAHRMFDVSLHSLQQLFSLGEITKAAIEVLPGKDAAQILRRDNDSALKEISENFSRAMVSAGISSDVDHGCILVRRLSQAEGGLKTFGEKRLDSKNLYPSPPHCAILEGLTGNPSLKKLSYSMRFAYGGDASLVLSLLKHGIGRWEQALNDPSLGWHLNAVTLDCQGKTKLEPLSFIPCCIHSFLWHKVFILAKAVAKSNY